MCFHNEIFKYTFPITFADSLIFVVIQYYLCLRNTIFSVLYQKMITKYDWGIGYYIDMFEHPRREYLFSEIKILLCFHYLILRFKINLFHILGLEKIQVYL